MNSLGSILQKAYSFFGVLSVGLTLLVGILGAIAALISRSVLINVLQVAVSPVLAHLLGAGESGEVIAYLVMLIKFSPLLISLVMLAGSIIVSVIVTLPDLCTAYFIGSDSPWLPLMMGISIIKNIAIFPIGTILSVLSIIFLIGYFAGHTPAKA